jgi:exodeoxyribonuclease V alpha subunit
MEIPCIVEKMTFQRDKFAILACNLDPYSYRYNKELEALVEPYVNKKWGSFTVVVDTLSEGEKPEGGSYVFVGDFEHSNRGGMQYKASGYYRDVPTTTDGMKRFLMSLPNIKTARANQILNLFPLESIIGILDDNPKELLAIRGITEIRLEAIVEAWQECKHKRELYEWFMECNIPIKLADKAYSKWENRTREFLTKNPYLLTELPHIGFLKADIVAHRISKNVNLKFRTSACLEYCLKEDSRSNGNLCTPYNLLKALVIKTLRECDSSIGIPSGTDYGKQIPHIVKDPLSLFTAVKDKVSQKSFIYLTRVWEQEKFIGETIHERTKKPSRFECTEDDIEKAEGNISYFLGKKITLDGTQREAIKSAFENRVTIITGGGGTGKSTICRCIYSLAQKKKMDINMMSPTGKAAKVLSERTGGAATTIHRGLGTTPGNMMPSAEITQDLLLIDEVSMSGVDTMYLLMVAIENNPRANIIFVGDKNQLPSVSPGNFLSDIISSGCANVVTLDTIHRQDDDSYISIIANEISRGSVKSIPSNASDITWHNLQVNSFEKDIVNFVDKYLDDGNDMDDLQFLSPMKKGSCGVHCINAFLQEKMAKVNGKTDALLEREFAKYYVGDRIIQIKNNYEKSVFNGDMGTITEVGERIRNPHKSDVKEKYVVVDFFGETRYYYGKEIDEILLAWVITVHKFQGSQSKNIAMIMASEASVMMNKELVYTGFTRAEKHLHVFGHDHMYRLAPTRSSIKKRFTNLNNIIEELQTGERRLQVV